MAATLVAAQSEEQSPGQGAKVPELLPADVRLMIDVSGSMKRTDPKNLRKPALELLVRLLPDDSQAGIWTFGTQVNQLMPHQAVNSRWREQALTRSNSVTSNEMHTHIGAALERAAFDLDKPSSGKRNIIFLTDGLVDIAKDTAQNTLERERILQELLPRLQAAGYTLHTIALSEEADHDLMEKLAKATDGVYASVLNAEDLMGVFLRIFDQAVPQERLPLNKNRFLVDESVDEFTVLVFRSAQAAPTELQSPDGNNYTGAREGVSWYKSDHYDLITVSDPRAGEWILKAEQDPDNRVTVVSDLKLVVTPPQNNIEVSQALDLHFLLQEAGETLRDPQFLQLLSLDVTITRPSDERQWQNPIPNRVPPIDGVYHQPLDLFRETGQYTVQLQVDGKTFKREYKHHVTVGSPFSVDMERLLHQNRVAYRVRVRADDQRVDLAKTAIVGTLRDSEGGSSLLNFEFDAQLGEWQLLVLPETAARYSLGLQVSGQRIDGSPVKETLASRFFVYPDETDPQPDPEYQAEPEIPEPELSESETENAAIDEETPDEALPPVQELESSSLRSWLFYSSIFLANVLVFTLAFFAYRMIMGKKARDEAAEIESALNTDVQKIVDKKSVPPPMQEVKEKAAPAAATFAVDLADEDAIGKIKLDESRRDSPSEQASDDEGELSDLDAFLEGTDFGSEDDDDTTTNKN